MTQSVLAVALSLALLAPAAFAQAAPKAKAGADAKSEAAEDRSDMTGVIVVSDREFNTFVFGSPVKKVMFPSGSPVNGAPVYLPGNESVVIEFGKSERPTQMLVVLEDGSSKSLRVLPRPVKGVEHRVDGVRARKPVSRDGAATPVAATADARAADMELLKRIVMNDVPDSFDAVPLPKPIVFDKFRVVPMRGWSDGAAKRAMVFALVANPGQTAVVAAPQFYRPGITAVMVDGDVVDEQNSPLLYVVEEASDE